MNPTLGDLVAPMPGDARASGLVREFRPSDKGAVLALFSETFGPSMGQAFEERWNWLLIDHPFSEPPILLVAESNRKVIGFLSAFPTPGLWQGKEIPMFCVLNFLVHPAHRGIGIPLAKTMVNLPKLLIGMPNKSSAALWKHLGSKDLGQPAIYTRILDIQALRPKVWHPILTVFSPIWMLVELSLRFSLPTYQDISIKEATDFPEECDDLWACVVHQGLVPNVPGRGLSLMTQRDRRFLRWRFLKCPGFSYQILLARNGETLVGYAVTRLAEKRGLRRGFLVDLLARPDQPNATTALLQAVEATFRMQKAQVIHCLASSQPSPWRKHLRRHGYWLQSAFFRFMASPNHPGLPPSASQEACFRHVSYADGELDFVV